MGGLSSKVELVPPAAGEAADDELFGVAKDVVYAPIMGQSLVELTVKRLLDVVSLGLIDVGEQLPSEPDLAERLGVSPATLREALAVLRGGGLVATRRGRGGGTVVLRDVLPPPADEARRRLACRSFDELRDLGDFWVAIAARAASLAAERATPADVRVLDGLATTLTGTSALADCRRLDAQLHIGIASAARSSRLIAGEISVHAELGEYASLLATSPARVRILHEQHAQIVEAVRDRDVAAAGEAAARHARTVATLLTEMRSELAQAHEQDAPAAFAGLRPYGSELGATSLELGYQPIVPTDATARDRAVRGRRDRSAPR